MRRVCLYGRRVLIVRNVIDYRRHFRTQDRAWLSGILAKYGKTAYANFPYRWFADNNWSAHMPSSIFDSAHGRLVELVVVARKTADLTQAQLGRKIGKSQSFVSMIERHQRRVDVIEFIALFKAMGQDPRNVFASLMSEDELFLEGR